MYGKPSGRFVPEPTTMSSAILFHWATVFPGGSAAAPLRVPADAATTNAIAASARTRGIQPRRLIFSSFADGAQARRGSAAGHPYAYGVRLLIQREFGRTAHEIEP